MRRRTTTPTATYGPLAGLFRALMHPARLAILNVLREGEACVCHLEAALGYRQAYISQQLTVLREAGLARDQREGLNVYYRVAEPRVFAVLDAAQALAGPTAPVGPGWRAHGCPCPKCNPPGEAVGTGAERRLPC